MEKYKAISIFFASMSVFFATSPAFSQYSSSGFGVSNKSFYAALAVAKESRAYGYSVDQTSEEIAKKVALRECRKHANDCQIEMWTTRCLAFARAEDGSWGTDWDYSKTLANQKASKICGQWSNKCKIVVSVCNDF